MQANNKHKAHRFLLTLCVLLSALTLTLLLTSCGGDHDGAGSAQNMPEIKNGSGALAGYSIVRGDNSGNAVLKAALNLRAATRQRDGSTLNLYTDFTESTPMEILVGPTNRPESLQAQKELNDSVQYILRSAGDKIVLAAATQKNLLAAVERLVEECINGSADPKALDIVQKNEGLLLYSQNRHCSFVVPDSASDEFIDCASQMLGTLDLPDLKIVRYTDYEGGPAVMLGKMPEDTINLAYSAFLNENEYIARTAAEKVYLLGANDLLTMIALGDYLYDLQALLDRDWEGNRYICSPADYSFNSTWNFPVPKPVQATLENSESISTTTHLFYYTGVSKYSLSLFKQVLTFLGYTPMPYEEGHYVQGDNTISLDFSAEDGSLSVTATTG